MTITTNIMENIHGVDVSWIHNAGNKGTLSSFNQWMRGYGIITAIQVQHA